nr:proline-rich protein 2-like [Odocoileus virginianus texanus]
MKMEQSAQHGGHLPSSLPERPVKACRGKLEDTDNQRALWFPICEMGTSLSCPASPHGNTVKGKGRPPLRQAGPAPRSELSTNTPPPAASAGRAGPAPARCDQLGAGPGQRLSAARAGGGHGEAPEPPPPPPGTPSQPPSLGDAGAGERAGSPAREAGLQQGRAPGTRSPPTPPRPSPPMPPPPPPAGPLGGGGGATRVRRGGSPPGGQRKAPPPRPPSPPSPPTFLGPGTRDAAPKPRACTLDPGSGVHRFGSPDVDRDPSRGHSQACVQMAPQRWPA